MWKKCLRAFQDLLYPPICLHCNETRFEGEKIFCRDCLKLLELIDERGRCPTCFSSDFNFEKHRCSLCSKTAPILDKMAAAFDHMGPAETLIKQIKEGDRPELGVAAGSFMAAQFLKLNWPMPDIIIPIPLSPLKRYQRGFNQSLELANPIASILQVPILNILKRKNGDVSQAKLSDKERRQFTGQTLYIHGKETLENKKLLLIDDIISTGTTFRRSAEVLRDKNPSHIYALALCRAI